jgi:hypothetical protein
VPRRCGADSRDVHRECRYRGDDGGGEDVARVVDAGPDAREADQDREPGQGEALINQNIW